MNGSTQAVELSDAAKQWSGWGSALKPAHEPIVLARKPLGSTVAACVLEHGTGALNIDACRVGTSDSLGGGAYAADSAKLPEDASCYATGVTGKAFVQPAGRWPANLLLTHDAACQQAGTAADTFGGGAKATSGFVSGYAGDGFAGQTVAVPVWVCVPGCPVGVLDQQSGHSKSTAGKPRSAATSSPGWGMTAVGREHNDSGGASRFFPQPGWEPNLDGDAGFLYCAKPGKKERNAGVPDGAVSHPTVKPVAVMAWLITLLTPPGGVTLDPFLGSGTSAVAAVREGFRFLGCEMGVEYLPILEGRIRHAEATYCGQQLALPLDGVA